MKTFLTKFFGRTFACALLLTSPAVFAGDATLIFPGTTWKYLDNGSDQGTGWTMPAFNDASWASGRAQLGYGDADEATVVSYGADPNNKYITTYFRKTFNVTNASQIKSLLLGIVCDDGAVIYINGVEATRYNMPVGPVLYNTFASSTIGNHNENIYYRFAVDPALLVTGVNTIAVEVHQDAVTSSDISFNLELLASSEITLLARGDSWQYLDDGTDQGTAWKDEVFNDAAWLSGKSILGYNSTASGRIENTTVSYGGNASNKYVTTYLRTSINIPDTSAFGLVTSRVFIDDGVVIYINGVEAARTNMPTGTILYNTLANTTVSATGTWINLAINKTLLKNGVNVIAAEVHQAAVNSSDIVFEFEFKEMPDVMPVGGGCVSQNIGCFTSQAATCQSGGLVLPSTHTFQYLMKQGDAYNAGPGTMPTNNDFTAYIPVNGSSEQGYLAINHENNPGGVSILDLHFNPYTGLWLVDSSQGVDYTVVVKSERNCSGGITPWGTVVSSEEAVTGGDANTDGYQDVGWHTEINPVTKSIVDYDNNGQPDKAWALGRSTKENICFASDSITSYFGLDAGSTSYVYKFVASQPGNLSAGTLYVLRQTALLDNTAQWIQVPNTTQADRNNCVTLSTGLGATSFNKVEDVEIGPDGKIYFTSSNDGRVYRFSDTPSITDFEIYIDKQTYYFMTGSGISSALFNNCDNLAFDPVEGNLWVNIDGNCNYLWMFRPNHTNLTPQAEIFARIPSGGESTGTTFSPDGRFMFVSIQHPSGSNSTVMTDAAGVNVTFNRAHTIVIARNENLGVMAAIPFVELGSNTTVCQGQPVMLDAGAGQASYAWSTGATTQTISVTTSGTYSVTVTGSNGRTNTDNITVTVNPLPAAPVSASQAVCAGSPVPALSATGTNIVWYSDAGLTTQVATGNSFNTGNTAAGTYTYYATQTDANGCTSSSVQTALTIHALPAAPSASNQTACEATSIPALTASGTNIVWYSDAGLTTQVATGNSFSTGNTAAGTYTYYVTQTDVNNCASPSTTTILTINAQPAAPAITGTTQYCAGSALQALNATGGNVTWYSDAGLTTQVATGNSFTPSVSSTTVFYATETSVDGCVSNVSSVTVTINALPVAPVSANQTACFGSSIPSLSATGSSISWFSDAGLTTQVGSGNTFNTGNTNAGTYTYYVTQTDGNGCRSTATMVTLTINALPAAPAVSGTIQYCAGDPIQALTATGTNVVWYSNASLTVITGTGNTFVPFISSTTTFYVTQTVNSCRSISTPVTVTINPLPTLNISGLNSQYLVTDPAATLSGTPAGGTFSGPGINGNTFDPAAAGVGGPYTITYTYIDPNTGCTNTTTSNVSVSIATGLVNLGNGCGMSVFPNPAAEQFALNLSLNAAYPVRIELIDAAGKMSLLREEKTLAQGEHKLVFERSVYNLAAGSYWLNVRIGGQQSTIKLLLRN